MERSGRSAVARWPVPLFHEPRQAEIQNHSHVARRRRGGRRYCAFRCAGGVAEGEGIGSALSIVPFIFATRLTIHVMDLTKLNTQSQFYLLFPTQ